MAELGKPFDKEAMRSKIPTTVKEMPTTNLDNHQEGVDGVYIDGEWQSFDGLNDFQKKQYIQESNLQKARSDAKTKGINAAEADLNASQKIAEAMWAKQEQERQKRAGEEVKSADEIIPNDRPVSSNAISTEKTDIGKIDSSVVPEQKTTQSASDSGETKQQKKGKIKSILQAYYDGDLDKSERDYLIADTLGTFARNLGKDIGNVAAAYSGGTANSDREQSMWESRPEALLKQGTTAQEAAVANSDKSIERLKYIPAQRFVEDASKLRAQGNEAGARILEMVGAASANGDQGPEEYVAALYESSPEFKKLIDSAAKTGESAAGVVTRILNALE